MKKLFSFVALAFAFTSFASAQELAIAPALVGPDEYFEDNYLDVTFSDFNEAVEYVNWQFDIHVNKGLTLCNEDDGDEVDLYLKTMGSGTNAQKKAWSYTLVDFGESPLDPSMKQWRVTITNSRSYGIPGSEIDDAIMGISYISDADLEDGIYPVLMDGIVFGTSEGGLKKYTIDEVSSSFIQVGMPKDASLAIQGTIPSFVNEALAYNECISTLDLSEVTSFGGTFTYVDGRTVKAPKSAVKGKVAYKREVSGLASVCLPFAADIKAYTYSNMAGEYAIFDEVSNLAANTPAIVNANIDITVADATIGSVEGKTINSGYYLKGGNLCKVNGSAKIAPLRGCWDITAPVKGFKFNDADAILTVDANANEDIFNLNGVKLNKAQRGVNIIGGKKVMK